MMDSPRTWGLVLAACAIVPLAAGASWFGGSASSASSKTAREPELYEVAAEQFTAFFLAAESWNIPGLPVAAPFLDLVLTIDTCASYRRHQGSKKHPWLQVQDALVTGKWIAERRSSLESVDPRCRASVPWKARIPRGEAVSYERGPRCRAWVPAGERGASLESIGALESEVSL